jgi:phage terminase large subunit-like protein
VTLTLHGAAPRWASPRLSADTDGPRAAAFIETFGKVLKGEQAGQPVTLRPWQRELLDGALELDEDGRWRHRTGLIGIARKNGKSLLGSALGLYGLVASGEQGAEVYSCAGTRAQAGIVFDEAKKMVARDPDLSEALKVYKTAIEFPQTGSVWRVLSAEAFSAEGLNPYLVIFDEVHVQPDWSLWEVMTQGSATRPSALTLGITTAGHDRESMCYRLYEHGRKVVSGEVEDPSFFFRWWEPADPDADYREPSSWAEGNPGLGDFQHVRDFQAAALQAEEQGRENAFRRYRLNQWTSSEDAWLPWGAWDRCADAARAGLVAGLDELRGRLSAWRSGGA